MANATTTAMATGVLYSPSTPVHGQWNLTHTTTYGIVYLPNTAPTPWPFLAASLALSVVSGLIGYAGDFMVAVRLVRKGNNAVVPPKDAPWGLPKLLLKGPALLISTVRAFALLIATAKAQAQRGGRFSAPSVLVVFFFSLLPYATDPGAPHAAVNAVAALDMAFVFICIIITSYRGYFFGAPLHAYGKFFGVGGTCPRTVQDCNGDPSYYGPGCNMEDAAKHNATSSDLAFSSGRGYILYQELAWTIMIHFFALIFLGFLVLACGGCVDRKRWHWNWRNWRQRGVARNTPEGQLEERQEPIEPMGQGEQVKDSKLADNMTSQMPRHGAEHQQREEEPSTPLKSKKEIRAMAKEYLSNIPLLLMLVFSGATFTAHYFQETREKPITIIDSFGPLQRSSDNNITSWTDCFQIHLPVDEYGFWAEWYASQKGRLENVISVT